MMLRQKIDSTFQTYGRWLSRHAVATMVLSAALAVGLAVHARHVVLEFHPETFLDEEHAARIQYNAFKDTFGSDDAMLIAVRSRDPWSADFLAWLRELHTALESRVPHVDEVTSIVNARHTRGEGDELIVEDLMEEWPSTPAERARVAAFAESNPLYQKLLLDSEHRLVTILVELAAYASEDFESVLDSFDEADAPPATGVHLTGTQRSEAAQSAAAVVSDFQASGREIHLVGSPVNGDRATGLTRENMSRFTALSFLCITGILWLLCRRWAGVLLPLAVSLLSLAAAFGAAGLRGAPLSVTVQILPSLLLAVGVSSSIHLVVIFFQGVDAGRARRDAVAEALGHSALPVVLASLTTAAGLASFNAAELAGLRDLGVLAPIGIVISLFLSLTLLPATLALCPARPRRARTAARTDGQHESAGEPFESVDRLFESADGLFESAGKPFESVDRLEAGLVALGDFATRHPVAVVTSSLLLTGLLGLGAMRLEYTFDPLTFLHEDDPLRLSTQLMNDEFVGVSSIDFVLDSGVPGGLYEPEFVAGLDAIHQLAPSLQGGTTGEVRVGKAVSYVDILKEIHQALHENRADFYTVPEDRALIAQELLLFENAGSDDLEEFVDSEFRKARLTLRVPWIDASKFGDFIPETEARFREILGQDVALHSTGVMPVATVIQEEMKNGLIKSYGLAVLVITPLMIFLLGSTQRGLISMIPNLMPIVAVLGAMGWLGLDLNIFTMLIGCIAIGLAVDDTIHFTHQFYRYHERSRDPEQAVRDTMRTTGQALLTTSVVLSAGFLVYVLGGMRNLEALGIVTTASIALAFLSDVVVAPALLTLVSRGEARRQAKAAGAEREERTAACEAETA